MLRTFIQNSITFCNLLEAASDSISAMAVVDDCLDISVEFLYSRLNNFRVIRSFHFVFSNAENYKKQIRNSSRTNQKNVADSNFGMSCIAFRTDQQVGGLSC